jgi:hypothetical protein
MRSLFDPCQAIVFLSAYLHRSKTIVRFPFRAQPAPLYSIYDLKAGNRFPLFLCSMGIPLHIKQWIVS